MSAVLDKETTEELIRHKPAFIRRVQIRGYKSIAFCDVTLEPLTILVGRNASGKSNFLDALSFARDVLERGANSAAGDHGGESIFCRTAHAKQISIEMDGQFESLGNRLFDYRYEFEVAVGDRRQLVVTQEALELVEHNSGYSQSFKCKQGEITWDGLENLAEFFPSAGLKDYPRFFDRYSPDRLLLGIIGSQPYIDLLQRFRTSNHYRFSPDNIRKLYPRFGHPQLDPDGSNLARAIAGLAELDPASIQRATAYLSSIVPEIESFRVLPLGDFETVQFSVRPAESSGLISFNASSMSDGTLRILASLIAAFQVYLPGGNSGLVALEEPETSLHPAAMNALVDALDEATLRTQVLLTTHSVELLDNPTIKPENIRVVQMIGGTTVIGPVDAGSIAIVQRNLDTLGGLERQNQLEPDFDDQERQRRIVANGAVAVK